MAAPMEKLIFNFINTRGGGVTFAELAANIPGFPGNKEYLVTDKNFVLWSGLSDEAIDALNALRSRLSIRPTSILTYYADGAVLRYPLVKRNVRYKDPHWLPVAFYIDRGRRMEAGL